MDNDDTKWYAIAVAVIFICGAITMSVESWSKRPTGCPRCDCAACQQQFHDTPESEPTGEGEL